MLRTAIYRAASAVAASMAPDEMHAHGHDTSVQSAQPHVMARPQLVLHQGEYQSADGEVLSLAVRSRGRSVDSQHGSVGAARIRGREPSRSRRSQRARPHKVCVLFSPQAVYLSDSDDGEPLVDRGRQQVTSAWRAAVHYASCGLVSRYESVALEDSGSDSEPEPVASSHEQPSTLGPSQLGAPSQDSVLTASGMDDNHGIDEQQLACLIPPLSPARTSENGEVVNRSSEAPRPAEDHPRIGLETRITEPPLRLSNASEVADLCVASLRGDTDVPDEPRDSITAAATGLPTAAPTSRSLGAPVDPMCEEPDRSVSSPPRVQITPPSVTPIGPNKTGAGLPRLTVPGSLADSQESTEPTVHSDREGAPAAGKFSPPSSSALSEESGAKKSHSSRTKSKKRSTKTDAIAAAAVVPAQVGEDRAEAAAGGFNFSMQNAPDEFGFTAADAIRAHVEATAREVETTRLEQEEPRHKSTFPLPKGNTPYSRAPYPGSSADTTAQGTVPRYAPTRGPDLPHFGFAQDPWPAADPLDAFTVGYDFDHITAGNEGTIPPGWGDGEELMPPMRVSRESQLPKVHSYQTNQQPFTPPIVPLTSALASPVAALPSTLMSPVARSRPSKAKSVSHSVGSKKGHHARTRSRSASSYAVPRGALAASDTKDQPDDLVLPKASRPRAASSSAVVPLASPFVPGMPKVGNAVDQTVRPPP